MSGSVWIRKLSFVSGSYLGLCVNRKSWSLKKPSTQQGVWSWMVCLPGSSSLEMAESCVAVGGKCQGECIWAMGSSGDPPEGDQEQQGAVQRSEQVGDLVSL